MTDNLKTWPERILLNQDEYYDEVLSYETVAPFCHKYGVSWCTKQISENDVEYVRADLLESAVKAAMEATAKEIDALAKMVDLNLQLAKLLKIKQTQSAVSTPKQS